MIKDEVLDCIEYWNSQDFLRTHRKDTKTFDRAYISLKLLFEGCFFTQYPNEIVQDALINKKRKFTPSDFKTSLLNLKKALTDPMVYPENKDKLAAYCKRCSLPDFLFNKRAAVTHSMFLHNLKQPTPIRARVKETEQPELKKSLMQFFKGTTLSVLDENAIVEFCNTLPAFAKRMLREHMPYMTPPCNTKDLIFALTETLREICLDSPERLKFHWLNSNWFKDKLAKNIIAEIG